MVDQILEVFGLPVNAAGAAVLQAAGGDTTVVGNLPPNYFPVDATTGYIVPAARLLGMGVKTI